MKKKVKYNNISLTSLVKAFVFLIINNVDPQSKSMALVSPYGLNLSFHLIPNPIIYLMSFFNSLPNFLVGFSNLSIIS